jgi:hypothetical protein
METPANKPQASNFDMGDAMGVGRDQQFGEIQLMARATEIDGDASRSFLQSGFNDLAEFNYFADREFLGTRRLQVLTMLRGTDDQSVDPERDSLQKAYLRLYSPQDEYTLGDALVNYSRLSFNQSVKGLSATWKLGPDWKLSLVSGVFIDRYGSLYKDLPGRPYMALVSGARLQRKLGKNSTLGANFSSSDDRASSLPSEPAGTVPMPASNRVGSLDSKLQFQKLVVDGEAAYSFTDFDTRSGLCVSPCDSRLPEPGLGMQGDWGARVEGTYRVQKLRLRASYLRYEPNFASMNARQIADLQDFVFRPSYDLLNWLTVEGTMRRSNDNLKGQLPFETRIWGPEGRLLLHDLAFYRRATVELGYRHRLVNASNGSIDHFVRMPYIDLTVPYKRTYAGLGYELRQATDFVDPTQTSHTHHLYFSLRGVYTFGAWHVDPNLRWELERQAYRPGILQPLPDFATYYDSNRLNRAALSVEAPRDFILELAYRESSATIYDFGGYRRPSYRAALTYKVANDENTRLLFFFERNNNVYLSSPTYDERVTGVSLVYKFGRKGQ